MKKFYVTNKKEKIAQINKRWRAFCLLTILKEKIKKNYFTLFIII